jgi:hypothetical protein
MVLKRNLVRDPLVALGWGDPHIPAAFTDDIP